MIAVTWSGVFYPAQPRGRCRAELVSLIFINFWNKCSVHRGKNGEGEAHTCLCLDSRRESNPPPRGWRNTVWWYRHVNPLLLNSNANSHWKDPWTPASTSRQHVLLPGANGSLILHCIPSAANPPHPPLCGEEHAMHATAHIDHRQEPAG